MGVFAGAVLRSCICHNAAYAPLIAALVADVAGNRIVEQQRLLRHRAGKGARCSALCMHGRVPDAPTVPMPWETKTHGTSSCAQHVQDTQCDPNAEMQSLRQAGFSPLMREWCLHPVRASCASCASCASALPSQGACCVSSHSIKSYRCCPAPTLAHGRHGHADRLWSARGAGASFSAPAENLWHGACAKLLRHSFDRS